MIYLCSELANRFIIPSGIVEAWAEVLVLAIIELNSLSLMLLEVSESYVKGVKS